jgi:hypothetical protein
MKMGLMIVESPIDSISKAIDPSTPPAFGLTGFEIDVAS